MLQLPHLRKAGRSGAWGSWDLVPKVTKGFGVLGFRALGFRVFRVLGFYGLGRGLND